MGPSYRIAIFSYGLPVPGAKRGGIERAAHTLGQGLAMRGHHVAVFTHDPRPAGAAYERRDLPWHSFVRTWIGRRATMGYLGNLLAILPDYDEFDVVIAFGDSLLLPFTGKPIIRVLCGSALGEARAATSWGRSVLQIGVYLQELATALTQKGVVAISENTRRDNPFVRRVIPLGVDHRVFTPTSEGRTTSPSILFVGTLNGRKRGRMLLDLFVQRVQPEYPDATLALVGPPGPQVAGVTYYNGISDEQLAALYRRAWIYASPSLYEGFGLPYLEAMACGTPVVATPNPGSNEVLGRGEFGLLAEDSDFADSVMALLADESKRRALMSRGIRRAREYSLTTMLDRYESLLAEVVPLHVSSVAST